MKRVFSFWCITLCLLFIQRVDAQCLLTAIKPGEIFTVDQLWNVVVSGNLPAGQYKLHLEIVSGRKSIYKAETFPFTYNNKSMVINYSGRSKFEPLNILYFDAQFNAALMQAAGIVSSGKYTIKFTLLEAGVQGAEEMCSASYRVEVENNLLPLRLLFVHKEDTIRDACPTFGWLPPYPLPIGDYNYELVLTECLDGQLPFDATTKNMPVYKVSSGTSIEKNVCGEVSNLIPGKTYAWKINMYTNGKFDNTSESWRFYYEPEDTLEFQYDGQYHIMDEKIYASYVVIDSNLLPIKFIEDYDVIDSIVDMKLYDSTLSLFASDSDMILTYKMGTNLTYLNFCNYDFTLPKGRYLLEIICLNNKKYFIRFKNISEPEACH